MRCSPLRPIGWEQLQLLSRKEQLAVTFSALNAVYKLMVIYACIRLYRVRAPEDGQNESGTRRLPAGAPPVHDAPFPHAPSSTLSSGQAFEKREALLNATAEGGESGNGGAASTSGATTSSGEPLDARSLAAQVVVAK